MANKRNIEKKIITKMHIKKNLHNQTTTELKEDMNLKTKNSKLKERRCS
jgi:hypothetical protein